MEFLTFQLCFVVQGGIVPSSLESRNSQTHKQPLTIENAQYLRKYHSLEFRVGAEVSLVYSVKMSAADEAECDTTRTVSRSGRTLDPSSPLNPPDPASPAPFWEKVKSGSSCSPHFSAGVWVLVHLGNSGVSPDFGVSSPKCAAFAVLFRS